MRVTGGVAHITSGAFGDSDETDSAERRLYQEALIRHSLGRVVSLRHRYRYEQRWVDGQDTRTRFRYALFGDVALNGRGTGDGSIYLALYNEVFINGELEIGRDRTVERFDRNRFYTAIGFGVTDRAQVQAGYMIQTVPSGSKGQIQVSLHAVLLNWLADRLPRLPDRRQLYEKAPHPCYSWHADGIAPPVGEPRTSPFSPRLRRESLSFGQPSACNARVTGIVPSLHLVRELRR